MTIFKTALAGIVFIIISIFIIMLYKLIKRFSPDDESKR